MTSAAHAPHARGTRASPGRRHLEHPGLDRRERHRRLAAERSAGRGRPLVASLLAIGLFLAAAVFVAGAAAASVGVVGYAVYGSDLPDPRNTLEALEFTQQSTITDRTGAVRLATLGTDRSQPVTFDQVPKALADATVAIEDDSFWDNPGFDPAGFVSAVIDTLSGNQRGGSTITQQLVRTRLLPPSAFDNGPYERKIKEIIQSVRLTEAYPGVAGKQQILVAYLNNNFYGNRSYGVAAAAWGYWGKTLDQLTLAQCALLAAIPQSPTEFDLVRNATEQTVTDASGRSRVQPVVAPSSLVVMRRNYILQLMLTRSSLTTGMYDATDYAAAQAEPVVLTPPPAGTWIAAQFVWQVRDAMAEILCGSSAGGCEKIDTGGYTVVSTLDVSMQRVVEKWLYAAAIIPNASNPDRLLRAWRIPSAEWGWIKALRGKNIHNAAGAILDYRTGEVLAYAGSASYTAKGNRQFQPKFDVLEDGWRQPGSAIKPIDYVVGIEDRTMTAATMFMDVVTNFAPAGAKAWYPTQADGLERGPVRLRTALQFSLNIPAIKAGVISGVDHQFRRTKDFGLRYPAGTVSVVSESIGTLVTHPIDMISAYGAIANGGVLMPRHTILRILDSDGKQVWPQANTKLSGKRVVSAQAAYVITDILAGNTVASTNPFWAKWRITDGVTGSRVRPAAYKTGTTSDNRDVHAYGYLAPPSSTKLPALVAGVWMGNSDNSPNRGKLSLDTSAPLWSAILSDAAKGLPIEGFARVRPKGLLTAKVDAFTGTKPTPSTRAVVSELFIAGTGPAPSRSVSVTRTVDAATGLLWQDGCAGPQVTRAFVDYSRYEAQYPGWRRADAAWQARAARGQGVAGGVKGTRTTYFYGSGFYPFGLTWGGAFPPTRLCPVAPLSPPPNCVPGNSASPCPSAAPTPAPSTKPRP